MTIPDFLSQNFCRFYYRVDHGVSDVNTILASLTAQLVTAPVAADKWTENPAGTFTSPAYHGKYMVIAFSRIAADKLQAIVYDNTGVVICQRRIQIDIVAGLYKDVVYFTGKYYCVIDSRRATGEMFWAFLAIPKPADDYNGCPYPVFANGYRDSNNNVDGYGALFQLFGRDNGVAGPLYRVRHMCDMANNDFSPRSPDQRRMFHDLYVQQPFPQGYYCWVGRMCQALIGCGHIDEGVEKLVPIDDGTMGTFEATSMIRPGTVMYSTRLFMRKA